MVGDGVPVASQFAMSDRPALMVAFPGRTRNIGGTRRGWGGGGGGGGGGGECMSMGY